MKFIERVVEFNSDTHQINKAVALLEKMLQVRRGKLVGN
jgi:hypothetical protein